ncbi:hypothetical protein GCM10027612_86830 [Microbispora bryophytorum subsp. camponoti]
MLTGFAICELKGDQRLDDSAWMHRVILCDLDSVPRAVSSSEVLLLRQAGAAARGSQLVHMSAGGRGQGFMRRRRG